MAVRTVISLEADWLKCMYVFSFSSNVCLLCICHSDEGWLHKAVEVEGQLHIIEELQVFEDQQPVDNMLISAEQVAYLTATCTHCI